MQTKTIFNADRAVVINWETNEGRTIGMYAARLYVNCVNGSLGDATLVCKKSPSYASINNWAHELIELKQAA